MRFKQRTAKRLSHGGPASRHPHPINQPENKTRGVREERGVELPSEGEGVSLQDDPAVDLQGHEGVPQHDAHLGCDGMGWDVVVVVVVVRE